MKHTIAPVSYTHLDVYKRQLHASSFCSTWRADGAVGTVFVKSVPAHQEHILAAEADGLRAIAATKTVTVPEVVGCWTDTDQNLTVLALEWLDFQPMQSDAFGPVSYTHLDVYKRQA